MNAQQQVVEGEMATGKNDDFAIQHEATMRQAAGCLDQFREIAAQRLPGLGLQQHFIIMAEDEASKAIPLGLVEPAGAAGNFGD